MEIRIKSLKFDASEKLVKFTEKKVARLEKFYAGDEAVAEVTYTLEKDAKAAKLAAAGHIIERSADTFENAITACVDAMKESLTRAKEKKYEA
ncbi:MAG: HPF/RaiA family ribosome-associated protein [Bacteroidales bacterium]|nr:HPF/RaiA family ribosome-associated protein [Candidatus Cryptobacteroides aphodequi]